MSWRIWDFGFIADKTAAAPRRINYKPYALPASQHLSSSFSQGRLTTNHWMHNLNIFLAYLSFPMKQQLLGGSTTTNHMPPSQHLSIFVQSRWAYQQRSELMDTPLHVSLSCLYECESVIKSSDLFETLQLFPPLVKIVAGAANKPACFAKYCSLITD